ncbi:peptide-methionine (S)-S-oxide reductase MsrA [Aureibaculum sp. 2210JD6-5]|uniref:peptide-methionine (S)-S-oxide reductase MsrA n=1 Tax=Aureibaculum sp. 2210JD6-5 TaxID=3103957 RepID=UPI002AAD57AC|nr:peptide-methionine (S)-S-oxide reductase MsrA [Aureibaculum sp. 2210JD6-5]MDY7393821.1 peptide-methionine (S)-S-oxide reductase MsrA [Aureibaculum sp. 2210JD6-5]
MINKSVLLIFIISFFSCNIKAEQKKEDPKLVINHEAMEGNELATFGNGCFWCTEAIFQQLEGVSKVESGYAGGSVKNPTYKEVTTGTTGHAEVIRLSFDPKVISYTELLEVFFSTHDPTTLNRQGADVGTQYRSAIFYHNEEQKNAAEAMLAALEKENIFDDPIVTEITALNNYYPAEDYHQNYYNNNKNQGYCRAVINPKLEKFKKQYKDKLKKG